MEPPESWADTGTGEIHMRKRNIDQRLYWMGVILDTAEHNINKLREELVELRAYFIEQAKRKRKKKKVRK